MKRFSVISAGSALLLSLGFVLPVAAQQTYNFGTGGNCNFPPATCSVTGSSTVASNLTISGWAAASGANFAAATITDQSGSGIGMNYSGETTSSPQHAIDNDGQLELVMLNFNNNKVVLTGAAIGWRSTDADVSFLRWTGTSAPDLSTTKVTDGTTGLVAKGWSIVSSVDMYTSYSGSTGLALTAANSSSWWIVSSYFGGAATGLNAGNDYFKLLSVSAKCISNIDGNACNTPPNAPGIPEPASLALALMALAGVGCSRRRKGG